MKHKQGKDKNIGPRRSNEKRFIPPKSLEDFLAMPERDQENWRLIGQITTEMRLGSSLNRASRKFGLDPRKVRDLARTALRKLKNGRWAAKKSDRLLRVLYLLDPMGLIEIALRDSRQATMVGKYWNAVDLYRDTGDASAMEQFQGQHIIDANGKATPLLTDLHELDRLGSAGFLSFGSCISPSC
jgi:hypothetical protein